MAVSTPQREHVRLDVASARASPYCWRTGSYIILPTVTLEVARECSGAGLLIAVLAIGLPLASLALRTWWSRITLVASSVMIAIVANWVRLTVMGVYAESGGKGLHGPYHILQGLFVDWVAFGFLFVGTWLLNRLERTVPRAGRASRPDSISPHHPVPSSMEPRVERRMRNPCHSDADSVLGRSRTGSA